MTLSDSSIKIIKEDDCPLYEMGDKFRLAGKALSPPYHKATCLILAGDLLAALIRYESMDKDVRSIFYCSGCTGMVQFEYKRKKPKIGFPGLGKHDNYMGAVVNLLRSFSIFKELNEDEIRDIVSFLRLDKFSKGEIVLRKGEPGKKLFIIVSGKVEVLGDGGVNIASLGRGEVFGEMSLLSGEPVTATVKAKSPAKVLYLNGEYFRKMLGRFPPLQIYLARLLARRLAKANAVKIEELSSGVTGKLSEIPPSGLFQTFNLNQKTGILKLNLPEGSAHVTFREGELVHAEYNGKTGTEAFFELLNVQEGYFRFISGLGPRDMNRPELGDFMGLLMEGVRRIDESRAA